MAKKQTTSSKSLGFWEKLGMTFTRPSELFSAVSSQKGYGSLLKYFSVFVGVFLFIYWLYFNLSPEMMKTYGYTSSGLVWGISFIGFVIYALFAVFAGPFISAGLSHLGVMWLGGKQGYYNTFKPLIYGGALSLCYSSVVMLLYVLGALTGTIGVVIIFSLIGSLISIGGGIHALYVQSTGVAMYHKIGKWRAFFGMILVPLIIGVILGVLFVILIILLVASGTFNQLS